MVGKKVSKSCLPTLPIKRDKTGQFSRVSKNRERRGKNIIYSSYSKKSEILFKVKLCKCGNFFALLFLLSNLLFDVKRFSVNFLLNKVSKFKTYIYIHFSIKLVTYLIFVKKKNHFIQWYKLFYISTMLALLIADLSY